MKKLILFMFGLLAYSYADAWVLVTEAPIKSVGTPVTISVSSGTVAMTKVPSSQTSGRVGVYVSNPSTSAVAGFLGDCTSTALASTIRPFQFALTTSGSGQTNSVFYIPMREDICLWLTSLLSTSASQSIHYQEVVK